MQFPLARIYLKTNKPQTSIIQRVIKIYGECLNFRNYYSKRHLPLIALILPLALNTLIILLPLSEVLFRETLQVMIKNTLSAAAAGQPKERQAHKNVMVCPHPSHSLDLTPWLLPKSKRPWNTNILNRVRTSELCAVSNTFITPPFSRMHNTVLATASWISSEDTIHLHNIWGCSGLLSESVGDLLATHVTVPQVHQTSAVQYVRKKSATANSSLSTDGNQQQGCSVLPSFSLLHFQVDAHEVTNLTRKRGSYFFMFCALLIL